MKKIALVTGSTKGIGKQIAVDLLCSGHFVILNYAHSDDIAESVSSELRKISDSFTIIKADLSSIDGLERLMSGVFKVTNVIDILILNAGITIRSEFEELTLEQWSSVFNVNLTVPFFLVQNVYKIMRYNGKILFVGSVLGRFPHSVSIPYGVSKGALEILVKYLVQYVLEKKITVNVVAPGFTDTDWQKGKDPDQRKRIEAKIASKRFADACEISSTCLHLIENSYINGQTINVDGGYGLI